MKIDRFELLLLSTLFFGVSDSLKVNKSNGIQTYLLSPAVNAYGGRIGQRAVIKCRAKYTADATIKWYKETSGKSCIEHNRGITLGDTEYCLLKHSRLIIRKKTILSKLVFRKPRRQDSGIYMCMVSYRSNNITHKTLLNFHAKPAPSIRIIDSPDGILADGVVEIFYNRSWNRVRFYTLTNEESHIICKSLGYNFGSEPRFLQLDRPRPYRTRTNKRTKFLSLKCPKDAHASLRQCTFWYKSMSDTAAGRLTCTKRSDKVKDVAKRIRLRGYNRTDKGRVEVFHKGVWGFVYPQWIQFHEADMFCRMLGFKYGGEPIFDDSMPTTRSTLWIRYIDCPVNATTLTDCILSWEGGTYFFDRAEGGGVTCRKTPKEVPVMPFRNRLNDRGIEKLQYYKDGYWGTVCGAYIGTPEASMVCSMMGLKHGGHFKKTVQDYYLKAIGPVLLRNLDCPLNSTDFSQCQFRNNSFLSRHTACGKYSNYRKDVSLICNKNPPRNIAIRLNGSKRNKGFLEVSNEGKWKIVSYASNPALASVVCRQLGFRHGGEMYISDLCKTRNCTGADSFSGMSDCTGKERNLGQCNELIWRTFRKHLQPLGISCYEKDFPYEVMDTLNENLEGQVTLKRNDSFYSVSATLWDDIHARAHCKSLGHRDGKPLILNNANRVSFYNFTMYNNRQTIQRMYCGRESQDLYDCFHTGWNQRLQGESSLLSFVSNAIAGVKCSK